jgi:hypothetical protein
MRDLRLKVPALSLQVRQLCPIPPHCVQSCGSSSGTSAASAARAAWVRRRHAALRNRRSLGRPPGFSEDGARSLRLTAALWIRQDAGCAAFPYFACCWYVLGKRRCGGHFHFIYFYFTFLFYFFFFFDRWDFRGNGNLDGRV